MMQAKEIDDDFCQIVVIREHIVRLNRKSDCDLAGRQVMLKASWMALLTIGMLLPSAGLADDEESPSTAAEPLSLETRAVEDLLADLAYESHWQLLRPVDAIAHSGNRAEPIAEFDFRDASALARASKIRSLSLLTLGEFGQSRLFLGINSDGLAGLHFRAFPGYDNERDLEMLRMPYLDDDEPENEFERIAMESN